jgi:hypothetical protein
MIIAARLLPSPHFGELLWSLRGTVEEEWRTRIVTVDAGELLVTMLTPIPRDTLTPVIASEKYRLK